jgi:hypothetical protein
LIEGGAERIGQGGADAALALDELAGVFAGERELLAVVSTVLGPHFAAEWTSANPAVGAAARKVMPVELVDEPPVDRLSFPQQWHRRVQGYNRDIRNGPD